VGVFQVGVFQVGSFQVGRVQVGRFPGGNGILPVKKTKVFCMLLPEAQSFYLRQGLAIAERVLGLGDRDPASPTFGCFDRYYWHYKALDFPNARAQEIGHYLAVLYANCFEGNRYAGEPMILKWAEAAVRFWSQIQNRDGSFNEWWPGERSFCATSFSTYAAVETVRILGLTPPMQAFDRAAEWLCKNNNPAVGNQVAASALALRAVADLLGEEFPARKAEERVRGLLDQQDPAGFFPEYGGGDVGYQSLTVSLLAAYRTKAPGEAIASALRKAVEFLDRRLCEDGTFDYKACSRQTQFFYLSGLVRMREMNLLLRHWNGCRAGTALLPSWMDDRYCFQLGTDYLIAGLED